MNSKKKERLKKIIYIVVCIVAIVAILIYYNVKQQKGDGTTLTYDQVITYVEDGEIQKIEAKQYNNKITVIMKDGTKNTAIIPSFDELTSFISEEIKNGSEVKFEIHQSKNNFLSSILGYLPSIILLVFYFFVLRRNMGGDNFKAESVSSTTTFADVAGIEEEKQQLQEVVEFLKNPEKYRRMGAKIPKGILLNGAPGTGKTLLARAIAGEAGVAFLEASGSEFEEKFVGVGASRVRKLFKRAEKLSPCIIFIDEIDSVAQSRYQIGKYNEQTLNQLLSEMDGIDSKSNVIVIAATNHIEVLDSAILRPGRFDRHIYVPMPDVVARRKILKVHARNKTLAEDVSLKEIAKKTVGFSGADLANVLNEATIYAVNQNKQVIENSDIDEAIARVMLGLEKKNVAISDEEKYVNAVHEAGHAIVSAVLRPEVKNFGISIIPRGKAGGYNFFDGSEKLCNRESDMRKQMQVLYAGRVAEQIVFGDVSIGASGDLEQASKIAYLMVTKFAMNHRLLVKIQDEEYYNQQIDTQTMASAEEICKDVYDKTLLLLEANREVLEKLSNILYNKEYLSQEEIIDFMKDNLR